MSEKKYKTDRELSEAIDVYFSNCEDKPTITGLAYHLGFADRCSFYDYESNGEHSYTIKRARLAIESNYESKLLEGNCTGAIFALKTLVGKISRS